MSEFIKVVIEILNRPVPIWAFLILALAVGLGVGGDINALKKQVRDLDQRLFKVELFK